MKRIKDISEKREISLKIINYRNLNNGVHRFDTTGKDVVSLIFLHLNSIFQPAPRKNRERLFFGLYRLD